MTFQFTTSVDFINTFFLQEEIARLTSYIFCRYYIQPIQLSVCFHVVLSYSKALNFLYIFQARALQGQLPSIYQGMVILSAKIK